MPRLAIKEYNNNSRLLLRQSGETCAKYKVKVAIKCHVTTTSFLETVQINRLVQKVRSGIE
jgi:hypothetical protein